MGIVLTAMALRLGPARLRVHALNRTHARSIYGGLRHSGPLSMSPRDNDDSWNIHTTELQFVDGVPEMPCYRVMDEDGALLTDKEPEMDKDTTLRVHEAMVKTHVMDHLFYEAQRQGRISFYMTSTGEEATVCGSAAG